MKATNSKSQQSLFTTGWPLGVKMSKFPDSERHAESSMKATNSRSQQSLFATGWPLGVKMSKFPDSDTGMLSNR